MEIISINIAKNEYGPHRDRFTAAIKLKGGSSYPADINIGIPDEMLSPIVGIIQQAAVESMARSAAEFAENVAASLNPVVEHERIEAAPASSDDEPF